ncbi:MAG: hypothetical protein LBH53_00275, partial [Puniceicoccales bacterium]|nr:hypothetical protein [Puniceicoccales bacterium]
MRALWGGFGGTHVVPATHSSESIQSLVNSESVSSGDTLQFESGVYVFSDHVEIDKNLGLCGAEFSEGGPLTVLEKSESAHCRFFSFSGDGGVGSGVRFIAFDGNGSYANGNGGAIYCYGSFTGGMHNSAFSGNEAGGSGGAIYCYGSFIGAVHSSIFSGNEAGGAGGAIYCVNFTGESGAFADLGGSY